MKEKATIYDLWRICKYYGTKCCSCPLQGLACTLSPENTIENIGVTNESILKWCKEHPVKTRQDKFLEMFPKASTHNTIIDICPCKVDYNYNCKNVSGHYGEVDCCDCKKSYWLEEVEE